MTVHKSELQQTRSVAAHIPEHETLIFYCVHISKDHVLWMFLINIVSVFWLYFWTCVNYFKRLLMVKKLKRTETRHD